MNEPVEATAKRATILEAINVLVKRSRRYREYFGWRRGWIYAIKDRPGATGTFDVRVPGYPTLQVRAGDTDLRTLCHVLCERGYESPFPGSGERTSWIIDAGANTGMASVYFGITSPRTTVIAIEPDPQNFALLVANTSTLPNVIPIEAALWCEEGSITLIDPGQDPGHSARSETRSPPGVRSLP